MPSLGTGRLARSYHEKAERGMTDREMLAILTEFEASGLGHPPENPALLDVSFREKQQEWYLGALDDALNLSRDQKETARLKMRKLLDDDLAAFQAGIAGVHHKGIPDQRLPDDQPITPSNVNPLLWLSKEAYAPWRLMDLTPEQEAVTAKSQGEEGWNSAMPFPEDSGDRLALFVPGILARASSQPASGVFRGSSYAEAARHLHPAQFRLAFFGGDLTASFLQIELSHSQVEMERLLPSNAEPFSKP